MNELTLVTIIGIGVFLIPGIIEKRRHNKALRSIPIRVNVNGIRGKSTATRLITAVLAHNGFYTIGKTTGTSARMLYPTPVHSEIPVKRRPQGPNIGEQKQVVREAANRNVEALVCECMAVNPDYQVIFQEEYLKANIGVIVNVLEDHMDVMGPTLDDVAESFLPTIPYNGSLVTVPGPYLSYFEKVARQRNTKVFVAPVDEVPSELFSFFDYVIFPENIAIAAAVGDALDIPRDYAFEAMIKAAPDPGATKVYAYASQSSGKTGYFLNGFAVNDADSTIKMWDHVSSASAHYNMDNPIYIMNCRADRVDRSQQFAADVLPALPKGTIIAVGESTQPITNAVKSGVIDHNDYFDCEGLGTDYVIDIVDGLLEGQLIYGIGNIHGSGAPLISQLTGVEWTG